MLCLELARTMSPAAGILRDEGTESHVGQRDPPAESALTLDGIRALRGRLDELEHRIALRRPYQELTESRDLRRDEQTVILAGQAGPRVPKQGIGAGLRVCLTWWQLARQDRRLVTVRMLYLVFVRLTG